MQMGTRLLSSRFEIQVKVKNTLYTRSMSPILMKVQKLRQNLKRKWELIFFRPGLKFKLK